MLAAEHVCQAVHAARAGIPVCPKPYAPCKDIFLCSTQSQKYHALFCVSASHGLVMDGPVMPCRAENNKSVELFKAICINRAPKRNYEDTP
eukprot:3511305-Pleurochrysis_carterae.AAC.1